MLSVSYAKCRKQALYTECHYAECGYAVCHYAEGGYAECHYDECHGALSLAPDEAFLPVILLIFLLYWN